MAEITGVVNSIIYRNSENGWTVLELCPDEGEKLTVVGALPLANAGERLELTGEFSSHPKYGSQFKAVAYHTIAPATLSAIERISCAASETSSRSFDARARPSMIASINSK